MEAKGKGVGSTVRSVAEVEREEQLKNRQANVEYKKQLTLLCSEQGTVKRKMTNQLSAVEFLNAFYNMLKEFNDEKDKWWLARSLCTLIGQFSAANREWGKDETEAVLQLVMHLTYLRCGGGIMIERHGEREKRNRTSPNRAWSFSAIALLGVRLYCSLVPVLGGPPNE